jgi:hypothetical protein
MRRNVAQRALREKRNRRVSNGGDRRSCDPEMVRDR